MSGDYFCPYCMTSAPPVEYADGDERRFSCRNCGYPVEAGSVPPEGVRRPKILCIDDDKLLLGLFVSTLEVNGFEPVTASDGPSGLALARQLRPDLILVDVMMPGMSGIEVCKTIRSDPELRDTPIITITALTDKRIESKALEAGATLALQKPHDAHRLIEAIKTALGTRRRAAGST